LPLALRGIAGTGFRSRASPAYKHAPCRRSHSAGSLGGRDNGAPRCKRAYAFSGACVVLPPRLQSVPAPRRQGDDACGNWHRLQAALWSFPKLEQHSAGPHPFEGPVECFSLMLISQAVGEARRARVSARSSACAIPTTRSSAAAELAPTDARHRLRIEHSTVEAFDDPSCERTCSAIRQGRFTTRQASSNRTELSRARGSRASGALAFRPGRWVRSAGCLSGLSSDPSKASPASFRFHVEARKA
jgi:hypothetical protein